MYDEYSISFINFQEVSVMAGCGCGCGSSTKPKTAAKAATKKAAPKKKK
jgi:hypothetical protein